MKTPGQIVMISTENGSVIYDARKDEIYLSHNLSNYGKQTNQHLYLVSDQAIAEGDWVYKNDVQGKIFKWVDTTTPWYKDAKKVVATTDSSLGFPIHKIEEWQLSWIISYYNDHKKLPNVVFDAMHSSIEIYIANPKEFASTTNHCVEPGEAGLIITLRNGVIQVINRDTRELLHEVRNAPVGSWDKLWEAIKLIGNKVQQSKERDLLEALKYARKEMVADGFKVSSLVIGKIDEVIGKYDNK